MTATIGVLHFQHGEAMAEKKRKNSGEWKNYKLDKLLKLPEPMNITVNIVYADSGIS